MNKVRQENNNFVGIEPYDPKYLPAEVMISANENPHDVPEAVRESIQGAIARVAFNRYPDPLANELRDALAAWHGLERKNVLVGNGGDELLFNIALAWGGAGRTMLDVPPTFSVYAHNARLCGTRVVSISRTIQQTEGAQKAASRTSFNIDERAVLERLEVGDIDYLHICSPNNPTGDLAPLAFIEQVLDTTDALVVVDEAYGEFAPVKTSVVPLLAKHKNLAILRTFSKAYSLAGVRVGYVLTSEEVTTELCRARQPYSVDAVSQTIALEVVRARAAFQPGIEKIQQERARLQEALAAMDGVQVFESAANFLLIRVDGAAEVWQRLYGKGVLVRDFSAGVLTPNCLRVTVGSPQENNAFVQALAQVLEEECESL